MGGSRLNSHDLTPAHDWVIVPRGRHARERHSPTAFADLPALRESELTLLRQWLRSSAQERQWQSLLELAGPDRLVLADNLRERLLQSGAWRVHEVFKSGQWWPQRVRWCDLSAVQQIAGVISHAERAQAKQVLHSQLDDLARHHPWLAGAVQDLQRAGQQERIVRARSDLLQALADWQTQQRSGMRQDFALAAREHTKGITAAEWDWLAEQVPLEALGIARFEALMWLAGALVLGHANSTALSLPAWGCVGVPARQLAAPMQVLQAPGRYWLIENRASFERQALSLPHGVCLIWLPGRPSQAWQQAMAWLLTQAPAPADISCDPDPAGVDIALTAGVLWQVAQQPWHATHMTPEHWAEGTTRNLNVHDERLLRQLLARPDLPAELVQLCAHMQAHGCKAEQEGWL